MWVCQGDRFSSGRVCGCVRVIDSPQAEYVGVCQGDRFSSGRVWGCVRVIDSPQAGYGGVSG